MRIATTGSWALALGCVLAVGTGCAEAEFQGPSAEVSETNIKLDLPAVPSFEMPNPYPDGSHPVAEMRLKGNKFIDSEVQVKGYVIWVYDCGTAIRTPDMTDEELGRILKEEPERCNRPNFYLGDNADDPTDRGIWVVDVPRPPREDEKKVLPDEMLAQHPYCSDKANAPNPCPVVQVGDQVTVTGKWALKSPEGFASSGGLLVFQGIQNDSQEAAE